MSKRNKAVEAAQRDIDAAIAAISVAMDAVEMLRNHKHLTGGFANNTILVDQLSDKFEAIDDELRELHDDSEDEITSSMILKRIDQGNSVLVAAGLASVKKDSGALKTPRYAYSIHR
jgi:hypothetical protein